MFALCPRKNTGRTFWHTAYCRFPVVVEIRQISKKHPNDLHNSNSNFIFSARHIVYHVIITVICSVKIQAVDYFDFKQITLRLQKDLKHESISNTNKKRTRLYLGSSANGVLFCSPVDSFLFRFNALKGNVLS